MINFEPSATGENFISSRAFIKIIMGPVGCLAPDTLVITEHGPVPIAQIDRPMRVLSWNDQTCRFQLSLSSGSFPKGRDYLYRVTTQDGEFDAAAGHLLLCADGVYRRVEDIQAGCVVKTCSGTHRDSSAQTDPFWLSLDAPRCSQTVADYLGRYAALARQYGQRLLSGLGGDQVCVPSPAGAPGYDLCFCRADSERADDKPACDTPHKTTTNRTITAITRKQVTQEYWDMHVHGTHNYVTVDGTIHHNSGKSTVALFDLLARALAQVPYNNVRRTKFIILRNTSQQLKATVKPLIDQWFGTMTGNTFGQWRLTDATYEIQTKLPDKTILHTEFVMMAADTPDDVRRLLSVEASAAWCEEAREIDPEVFRGLQGRVARFPSRAAGGVSYPGVICSTNPPPIGGFWHESITKPPKNAEVFIQPPALLADGAMNPLAENVEHLDPDYYDNLIAANSTDWVDVYIKNNFGAGNMGQPVYRASFKTSFHVAKKPLLAVYQSINPLIVGMDNGLQAAAVIGQQDLRARVNILAECFVDENETMGVETFLSRQLVPLLNNKFAKFRKENIVFVLDPACFQRSQVDEKTIAMAVAAYGYQVLKAGTNDPERRVQAVEGLLARQIDGEAGFLIDPSCTHFISAMEWGYRYKKSLTGQMTTTFDKNHYSHIAESAQYLGLHYNLNGGGLGRDNRTKALPVSRAKYVYA